MRHRFLHVGVIFFLFLGAYLILVKGMGAHYGNTNRIDDALLAIEWDDAHAKALFNASRSDQVSNSVELLKSSIKNNPADSRAILSLAAINKSNRTNELMTYVSQLRPADGDVQIKSAAFWLERGDHPRAFALWNKALDLTSEYDNELFPFFIKSLQQKNTQKAFLEMISEAGKWWLRFFRFLNQQPDALPVMEYLFQIRQSQKSINQLNEYKILIARMLRESQSDKAYMLWLNSLDEGRRNGIGLLFDGGFEQPAENYGFSWHYQTGPAFIETAYSVGVKGRAGLHVVFQGKSEPFRHVWQRLRLLPGTYTLSGLGRAISLRTVRGLVWRVTCNGRIVGKSHAFEGNTPWARFSFQFEVPPDCESPVLSLIVEGRNPVEYRTSGEVWFDSLEIKHM
ncbi:MAG: hypothetical protein OEX19_02870 [Gammaproteobacteria bacterium]|nr:hypothetical protein [Gammaproteobacteria bacterium]